MCEGGGVRVREGGREGEERERERERETDTQCEKK